MNKRIKELASCNERIQSFFETGPVQRAAIEQFAELIVRECAKAADEGLAQVTMKVEWPSYHIKKHFGVDE
jgi:hypothetical protein